MNKMLVKPGQKVSFLECMKNEIQNQSTLKLTDNQGINQVASTVYNALLLSNISIIERTPEKFVVDYIEAGREAVIVDPFIDLVFKNDNKFPVYMLVNSDGKQVTAEVFGTVEDSGLKSRIEVRDYQIIPKKKHGKLDYNLPRGQKVVAVEGEDGLAVNVYKIYEKDGKKVKEELISKNRYEPQDEILYIGAKSVNKYDGILK